MKELISAIQALQTTCALICLYWKLSDAEHVFNSTDLGRLIDLHHAYCDMTPLSPTQPVGGNESCCGDCSRNTSTCWHYGTCCPDVFERVPTVSKSAAALRYSCEHPQVKPYSGNYPNEILTWLMETCADRHTASEDIQMKCEFANDFSDIDTKIPVTDTKTHIVYRNKYCALCNGVVESHMNHWKSYILCRPYAEHFYPSSMETIVLDVHKSQKCNVVFRMATADLAGVTPPKCGNNPPPISQCNVTGYWPVYDPLIEAGCHAYTSIYSNRNKYRNVFCYMCNNIVTLPTRLCMKPASPHMIVSFSALLNFPETPKEQSKIFDTACSEGQMFDPYKKRCRTITCSPPTAMIDGTCRNVVDNVLGVWYRVFLKFLPTTTLWYDDYLANKVNALELNALGILRDMKNVTHLFQVFYSSASVEIGDAHSCATRTTVDYFVVFVELHFSMRSGYMNSVRAVEDVISLDGISTSVISNISMEEVKYKLMLEYMEVIGGDASNLGLKTLDDGKILTASPMSIHAVTPSRWLGLREEKRVITKLLTCPLIELDSSEYIINASKACLKDLNVNFTRNTFIERGTEEPDMQSVLVCMDSYLVAIKSNAAHEYKIAHHTSTVVGIVSVICTCLSLFCLVISLVTYILFKDLHTQPGINNMILIITLMCAQSLFQFGIGQTLNIPKWACTLVGINIHFLWLLVLMSMNICSLHMFRVFNNIRKSGSASFSLRTTVMYVSYCVIVSLLTVAGHILTSLATSNWSDIGYGGELCYISDKQFVGYFFVFPIVFIVVINIALFLAVVIAVSRMPSVESNVKNTRNYFTIYAKLSSVTGITWVFGFVYYFTKVSIIEYAFVIFNACQGIFVFVSFVCNRRVLEFYKSMLRNNTTQSAYVATKFANTNSSTLRVDIQ